MAHAVVWQSHWSQLELLGTEEPRTLDYVLKEKIWSFFYRKYDL